MEKIDFSPLSPFPAEMNDYHSQYRILKEKVKSKRMDYLIGKARTARLRLGNHAQRLLHENHIETFWIPRNLQFIGAIPFFGQMPKPGDVEIKKGRVMMAPPWFLNYGAFPKNAHPLTGEAIFVRPS